MNFQSSTVATTRCLSCPSSPLSQSTSTKAALPMCTVQKDGAGGDKEEKEGETKGCMDDPAKRIRVKVASWLQELLHKAPPSSFLSAFLIINFSCSGRKLTTCFFPKGSGSPKQGPGIQNCLPTLGWRLAGQSLWLSEVTLSLQPFGLRADPAIPSWLAGAS